MEGVKAQFDKKKTCIVLIYVSDNSVNIYHVLSNQGASEWQNIRLLVYYL